jgi:hypothetical protein
MWVSDTRQIDCERLEYVSAMLAELRRLSGDDRHPMLSYLIEMAWLEARDIIDSGGKSGCGDKRDAVA